MDRISRGEFLRIDRVVFRLRDNPRPSGVKKLKDNIHRIRIGPWRIIFLIDDNERLVSVVDVVRRSESTYKGLGN